MGLFMNCIDPNAKCCDSRKRFKACCSVSSGIDKKEVLVLSSFMQCG